MDYRVVTIGREYGSGGGEVGSIVAKALGWRLVDQELLKEIAARAGVDESDAAAQDENVDPWLHRVMRPVWSMAADGVSLATPVNIFDCDAAAALCNKVVEEAHRAGNCVIVGRGAQCVLSRRPDVLHVFIYASMEERVRRLEGRIPRGTDIRALASAMDAQRLEYVRRHFGRNRLDPHLYDLMIDSHGDAAAAAELVLLAIRSRHRQTAGVA